LRVEGARYGTADAARSARYEGGFSAEIEHVRSLNPFD
jgi:hypothetical protein